MTDGSGGGIMDKSSNVRLLFSECLCVCVSSLLATCHMGSPLGLITKVHNVGEDGGKKGSKGCEVLLIKQIPLG